MNVVSAAATPDVRAAAARRYYPGLQVIRGLACLGVFVQHAYGYAHFIVPGPADALNKFNIGGTGIMLFFSLSAFLMLERSGDPFGKFVLDRLRRIFPLLWLTLPLAGWLSYLVHGASGLRWTTFLLIPTTVPAYVPVPFWSLSFELLFYMIVALAGLRGYRTVVAVVLLWCGVGMVFHQLPYHPANHALYPQVYPFFVTVFGYYFAAGMLARIGFNPQSRLRWFYGLGAIGVYAAVTWNLWPSWMFALLRPERQASLVFGLLGVGCFLAIRAGALWTPRSWPSRMLALMGDYSYGIYLMHMASMMVVHHWLVRLGLPIGFWTATAILLIVPLGPALLWGKFDLWLQRAMKRWAARRLAARQAPDIAAVSLPAGQTAPVA